MESEINILEDKPSSSLLDAPEYADERILDHGLFGGFVEHLNKQSTDAPLWIQAAKSLIHTIMEINDKDKQKLIILLRILDRSADRGVQELAVKALGCVASVCEVRELVHKYGAVKILLDKIIGVHQQCPPSLLKTATSTLLTLCMPGAYEDKVVSDKKRKRNLNVTCISIQARHKARHLNKVKIAFPALCRIVKESDDDDVLTNVCSIFACLTDDMPELEVDKNYFPPDFGQDIYERLVQLSSDGSKSYAPPAYSTIANMALREKEIEESEIKKTRISC